MKNHILVGFNYTYRCPLKCNFCGNPKSVIGENEFTTQNLIELVIKFSNFQEVERFVITGGEPFLYIDDIIKALKIIRENNVTQPFRIVTSGFWATEDDKVEYVLNILKLLGIDEISLSYDYEHAKYVSVKSILRIVKYAQKNGIKIEVSGTFWNENETLDDLIKLNKSVIERNNLVMPTGRAAEFFHQKKRYSYIVKKKSTCGQPFFYSLSIYPDGEVYPCCAGGFSKDAKLSCGNVYKDEINKIISNLYFSFHLRIAKDIGFGKLYELIKEEDQSLFKELINFSEIDTICQICTFIHSNESLMKRLDEIYNKMEIDYLTSDLDNWWKKIEMYNLENNLSS
jgi:MoaA/NifB/PqqE/SkfB family radical SAM enzyme